MASFQQLVRDVIRNADILLMVVDARQPETTVNEHLLDMIHDKRLIYVINKIDLVPEEQWKALKKTLKPSVAVSSTQHLGTIMLLKKINATAHGEEVKVGVIGYPNTGKSSLINALRSRGSASVSPVAGHTKALQHVRISKNLLLIDTPGVLPRSEDKDIERTRKHEFIGTIDVNRVKEPDLAVMALMAEHPGVIEAYYGVPANDDFEDLLDTIALKKNVIAAGGAADRMRMARQVLRDFQSGKMRAQ